MDTIPSSTQPSSSAAPPSGAARPPTSHTLAITALILAVLLAPVGLIMGIIVLVRQRAAPDETNKVLGIVAVVVGAAFTVPALLAFMGAIAYFGVLSPEGFIPNQCTVGPGLACTMIKVTSEGFSAELKNVAGQKITPQSVTASVRGAPCTITCGTTLCGLSGDWPAGETRTLTLPCAGLKRGAQSTVEATLTYVAADGTTHPTPIMVRARREE